MYRISVLAENRQNGLIYADRIRRFCMENGIFPEVKVYENQERFFEQIQMLEPTMRFVFVQNIFLWNLWKRKNFERDFRSGWSAEKSPVVSAGVKTADRNSCLNLRKEDKYEEEK